MNRYKITLSAETILQIKNLAARRNASISSLLAERIDQLFSEADYEQARRQALALLQQGFHLGGRIAARREDCHQR